MVNVSSERGRYGFDGDTDVRLACRGCSSDLVKTAGKRSIANDNVELALAA